MNGALCLAPKSRTHNLFVEEAIAARHALSADEPLERPSTELRAVAVDIRRRAVQRACTASAFGTGLHAPVSRRSVGEHARVVDCRLLPSGVIKVFGCSQSP